jgi:hypothetical protein
MGRKIPAILLALLATACATEEPKSPPSTPPTGDCLFILKLDGGRMLKWGPCNSPPPMTIDRM